MNPYYDTKECGLTLIDTLDQADMSYEFNTMIVVESNQSKKLYFASSCGCSCPTPFEEYHFRNDDDHNLNVLNNETLDQFINVVKNFPVSVDERQSVIRKVKYRLNKL